MPPRSATVSRGEAAVHCIPGEHFDGAVILGHLLGQLLEGRPVLLGPPVVQVAVGVELAAGGVEAVGDLVAHDGANDAQHLLVAGVAVRKGQGQDG